LDKTFGWPIHKSICLLFDWIATPSARNDGILGAFCHNEEGVASISRRFDAGSELRQSRASFSDRSTPVNNLLIFKKLCQ